MKDQTYFEVSISTDDESGDLLSVYFRVRRGRSFETREFSDGTVFADYNKRGELIGIELLGPCRVSIVNKLAPDESKVFISRTKEFMKSSGPRKMVLA